MNVAAGGKYAVKSRSNITLLANQNGTDSSQQPLMTGQTLASAHGEAPRSKYTDQSYGAQGSSHMNPSLLQKRASDGRVYEEG